MRLTIGLLMLSIALLFSSESLAQEKTNLGGYLVPMCVYNGDTIPAFQIPTIHIFKPLKFRNRKEQMEYYKLVRNVKKVYPIAREINRTIIETYEYLQTLPNEKPANVISNGWKRIEGAIYSTNEKALFCTRQTVDKADRPAKPSKFL